VRGSALGAALTGEPLSHCLIRPQNPIAGASRRTTSTGAAGVLAATTIGAAVAGWKVGTAAASCGFCCPVVGSGTAGGVGIL
jgi:hypothetical protein